MTSRDPLTIPLAIQEIIDMEAAKENRSAIDVLTDAVEQYHRAKMLAALGGYGQQRSRESGVKPDDVEEAIAQDRQRQASRGQ